jgi:acetyl esterase/lipase
MERKFPPQSKGFVPPHPNPSFAPPMLDQSKYKRKWLDVSYASQSPSQKMDIYLPEEGNGPFPVILVVHGGAFMFGSKGETISEPMLQGIYHGYAVADINYRLSGEAIFPAQTYDCKAAVRFLRANAAQYRLDGSHIAAWGPSAGGHLVAMLGASAGVKALEDLEMGNPLESSAVQAVVDWCGPAEDFIRMDIEFQESRLGTPDHSAEFSPESCLLGQKITEVPELVAFASPMTYITAGVPPFLIQHGAIDHVVPVQQSINFASALARKAGLEKVILEVLPGVDHHGDPAFETRENLERVFKFLDEHLK